MYRKSFEVVGYTYNADYHCIQCTLEYVQEKYKDTYSLWHDQFLGFRDEANDMDLILSDDEGNEVHPIFLDQVGDLVYEDDEDNQYMPHCGDCGEEIS